MKYQLYFFYSQALGLGLCPPGEMYYRCGTACERTCQNPSPRICTYQCVPNVCQCDNRFVRGWDGTCVPLSQCSMVSGSTLYTYNYSGWCWNYNQIKYFVIYLYKLLMHVAALLISNTSERCKRYLIL